MVPNRGNRAAGTQLNITHRNVVQDRVTTDACKRFLSFDIPTFPADDDSKFDFMVQCSLCSGVTTSPDSAMSVFANLAKTSGYLGGFAAISAA